MRDHGGGRVPTGAAVVARRGRRQGINVGAGGNRGTRGKDGFQQELQQCVAARAGDEAHKRAAAEQAVARIDRHRISAGVGGDRGARGRMGSRRSCNTQ